MKGVLKTMGTPKKTMGFPTDHQMIITNHLDIRRAGAVGCPLAQVHPDPPPQSLSPGSAGWEKLDFMVIYRGLMVV